MFPDSAPTTDVVVTGLGLTTSLGAGVAANWGALLQGTLGLRPLGADAGFDPSAATVRDGGVAPLPVGVDANAASRDGRARAAALWRQVLGEALRSAGFGSAVPDGDRAALHLGTSMAASASNAAFWERLLAAGPERADYRELQSYDVEPLLAGLAADLGIRGASVLVSNACAAGASSIALAAEALQTGEADLVLAAGGDTLELHTFAGFHALGLLSTTPPRPFAADRSGMQLGDGFAALVLERGDRARAAGRRPLARLLGCGEAADAHNLTQPHPQGRGAAAAMHAALRAAGCVPHEVDYLNLHATATPSNDRSEHEALVAVFGPHLPRLLLHAVKPQVGHTLGAAGAVEAVVTVKVLAEQLVPPTRGVAAIDPTFGPLRFVTEPTPARLHRAMSCSFGFGGANAVLLFGAAEEPAA